MVPFIAHFEEAAACLFEGMMKYKHQLAIEGPE